MAKKKKENAEPVPEVPPGLRLEWMDPASLPDNPLNWRTHPEKQTSALTAALEQVGWAGALLFNEKTGNLIDGHARKKISYGKGEKVPVLVGNWSESQEKLILATLDPLAALAVADTGLLDTLLREVATGDERLQEMLAELAKDEGVVPGEEKAKEIEKIMEQFEVMIIECGNEEKQKEIYDRMTAEGLKVRILTF